MHFKPLSVIAIATTLFGSACSDETDASDVSNAGGELYQFGTPWPSGNVNVCFAPDGNNPTLIEKAKNILANSWGQAAGIKFNGWNACNLAPAFSPSSFVVLHFAAGTNGRCEFGMKPARTTLPTVNGPTQFIPGVTNCTIISDDADVFQQHFRYEVIHEFGHALAFAHEQERPTNFDSMGRPIGCSQFDSGFTSKAAPRPGGTELNAFDSNSVMNYCATEPLIPTSPFVTLLSSGDIQGVRIPYGRNANAHGFMIVSDRNTSLAVNAFGGAAEGSALKLHDGCTSTNPDCTFSYQYGMLVSDRDPTLAINAFGGAKEGTQLKLTRSCAATPRNSQNPDCTWTYKNGQFLSDRDPTLAINASGGAAFGTALVLTKACTPTNPDCTWTIPNVMLSSARNSTLGVNAFNGATHLGALKLHQDCTVNNPDCTWRFSKGMITSSRNSTLAVNALNGASQGATVGLHNGCTTSNPDCTWTWKLGQLISDGSGATPLPINSFMGSLNAAPLQLNSSCSATNPDCAYSGFFASN